MDNSNIDIWYLLNTRQLIILFFGILGGSVRSLVLRLSFKDCIRVAFIGGSVALAIGTTSPHILIPVLKGFNINLDAEATKTAVYGLLPFMAGLLAVSFIEYILNKDIGKIQESGNGLDTSDDPDISDVPIEPIEPVEPGIELEEAEENYPRLDTIPSEYLD